MNEETRYRDQQRQARLLSHLLLTLIGLGAVTIISPGLTSHHYSLVDPVSLIGYATLAMLGAAWLINRRGHFRFAALLTLLVITAAIWVASLTGNVASNIAMLIYLILPILLSSLLLPLWGPIALTVISIVAMIMLTPLLPVEAIVSVPVWFISLTGVVVIFITSYRNQVEAERRASLADSEERFRRIFLEAPVGMALVGSGGSFTRVNRRLCKILGYTAQELTGLSLNDIKHPEERTLDITSTPRSLFQHELRCIAATGQTVWVRLSLTYIRHEEQHTILLMLEDITERRQRQAEAHRALQLEAELKHERGLREHRMRFISAVSHEFRTPLTTILSSSEMLDRYSDRLNPVDRVMHLQRIKGEVYHLNGMVDDLLEVQRSDSGQIRCSPEPLDLLAFCQTLVTRMAITGHTVNIEHDGDLTGFEGDSDLLRHVVQNLVSNAIKYSPRGSTVTLRLTGSDDNIELAVTDQGIGIPPEAHERLFELFYRAGNVGNIRGTGLGLAIVRDYVTLHGGTVSFTSEPDQGSTFTVRLPRAHPEKADSEAARSIASAS